MNLVSLEDKTREEEEEQFSLGREGNSLRGSPAKSLPPSFRALKAWMGDTNREEEEDIHTHTHAHTHRGIVLMLVW